MVLPRFSKVKQQTETVHSVLWNITWGTFEFGVTVSRKPLESDFEDALYPHQRLRNFIAIMCMVFVHIFAIYFFLLKKTEHPLKPGEDRGQLIFLNTLAQNKSAKKPKPTFPRQEQKHTKKQSQRHASQVASRSLSSPPTSSPVAAPPVVDTMSQITQARERRHALEVAAIQESKTEKTENNASSENEMAVARIKATIQAANYNRKGTNGIFQVLNKGVQTGRFSFRGWTNDPREVTRRTYEVDAGIDGDVELALIRKMIELIREHYSGDFNWDSQRMGRVVVLSARPADTASLERFMMKEFFDAK